MHYPLGTANSLLRVKDAGRLPFKVCIVRVKFNDTFPLLVRGGIFVAS